MYVLIVGFQIRFKKKIIIYTQQKNIAILRDKKKPIAPYAGGDAIFVLCFVVYTFGFRNRCVVLQ